MSRNTTERAPVNHVNSLMSISLPRFGEWRHAATRYTMPATTANTMSSGTIRESLATIGPLPSTPFPPTFLCHHHTKDKAGSADSFASCCPSDSLRAGRRRSITSHTSAKPKGFTR